MKIFLPNTDFSDEQLIYAAQIGADGVSGSPTPGPDDDGYFSAATLKQNREQAERFGLELAQIRMTPWEWNYRWMMGLEGRDEQIENFQQMIKNVGEAGIGMLHFNMHALRIYRTDDEKPWRDGTRSTSFDYDLVKDAAPSYHPKSIANLKLLTESERKPISDDQMWGNLWYFLERIIPTAEKAGVRIGLHPDDPPIPQIAGVARIMRSPDAFRRYIEFATSPNAGIVFCQGCFTEMGADIPAEIRYFASRDKIFSVDFRNIIGDANSFQEVFPNEGLADMAAAVTAYLESGFDGWFTPDHPVRIDGDTRWAHRYWAWAVGHMRGLEQAVKLQIKSASTD